MSVSTVSRSRQSEIFAHFFPSQSRENETIQSFIKTLLPLLNQQWYLNTDRILHKIRSFKDQMKIETYEKCLNATQKYLNSRDFSVAERYEVKKSWFFSGIQSYGETPRFQQLNSGLNALLKEVQPRKASWSESFRACWNGFIDCCSSAVSYTYNNPGKTACTFLALETAALAVRSYQQDSTFDASTSIVPWGNSPESHWSCGSNLVFGLSGTLLTQNPIFITAAGASCMPMAYGQIVNGQIEDQLWNVGDSYSLPLNMTELFGEPVTDVMMSQSDGSALPAWLNLARTVVGSFAATYAHEVVVSGNIAYVAAADKGLKIIDVSDKAHPLLISSLDTTEAYGVALGDNVAYVADGKGGLRIIDVSDSTYPREIGNLPDINAYEVAISGNIAYVADHNGSLRIIDVSDSAHPREISSLPADQTYSVAISGNTTYVTDYEGLKIIDVSNSSDPILKGSLPSTSAYGVAISGNIAYVADYVKGLEIIDVSNSASPILMSILSTIDARGVAISHVGSFAYVADGIGGLKIINVSDRTKPILVSNIQTIRAEGVTISDVDSFVYVADGYSGLKIIDLASFEIDGVPVKSKEANSLLVSAKNDLGQKVSKSFSVFTDCFPTAANLMKNPLSIIPGRISTFNLNLNNLFRDGDVSDTLSLSFEMQQSEAALPEFVQWKMNPFVSVDFPTLNAQGVAVSGDIAYVADGYAGLQIFDASNTRMSSISRLPTTNACGVAVSDFNYIAYVADGEGGLGIIDVSDSARPSEIGRLSTTNAKGVASDAEGTVVYVADGEGGLGIIDVSDNAHPSEIGRLSTTNACGVAVDFNYVAYVADGEGGLKIIDVSDSAHPSEIGRLSTTTAYGIAISDYYSFACIAGGDNGLGVIDVSDSAHPIETGRFFTTGVYGVAISGDIAYVADAYGLRIIDVNYDPPILKGSLPTAKANGIARSGNLVYMTDSEGMKIVDLTNYQFIVNPSHHDEKNYDLVVKATDPLLGTGGNPFTLRVEGAPYLNTPLPSDNAIIGKPFTWTIPEKSFLDPNEDAIIYRASSSVPPFLKFNPNALTFSGTSGDSDKGEYSITILASADKKSSQPLSTSAIWHLFVHHGPTSRSIPNQVADIGKLFNFTVSGTFTHPDDFPVTYSAMLDNQKPLPSWLHFTNQTQTFIGTPQEADKGDLALVVNVDDGLRGTDHQPFHLTVEHFPRLTKNFSSIYAAVGHIFSFKALSYFAVDERTLQFSAKSKDGELPKDLNFDNLYCEFTSTFQSFDQRVIPITLKATDTWGGYVSAEFNITVEDYVTALTRTNPSEVVIENRDPLLDAPLLQQTFSADNKGEFSVLKSFKDPDGDPLTFSADLGGANWLTLDPNTGTFSGTPSSRDATIYSTRRYTIGVTAKDPQNKKAVGSFDVLLEGPSLAEKILNAFLMVSGFAIASYGYYKKKYLFWNWCRKKKYQQPDLCLTVGQTGITYTSNYAANKIKSISAVTVKDRRCIKRDSNCLDMFKNTDERTFPGGSKAYLFDWLSYDPKTNQFHVVENGPDEQYLQENIQIQIRGTDDRIMEQFTIKVRRKETSASLSPPSLSDASDASFSIELKQQAPLSMASSSSTSSSATPALGEASSLKVPLIELNP